MTHSAIVQVAVTITESSHGVTAMMFLTLCSN